MRMMTNCEKYRTQCVNGGFYLSSYPPAMFSKKPSVEAMRKRAQITFANLCFVSTGTTRENYVDHPNFFLFCPVSSPLTGGKGQQGGKVVVQHHYAFALLALVGDEHSCIKPSPPANLSVPFNHCITTPASILSTCHETKQKINVHFYLS